MTLHVPPRLSQGFTLIELVTACAVLLILLGIGIPGFGSIIDRNQQVAAINQFSTALAHARYHAVTFHRHVILCPSVDHQQCTGGFDWESGQITFVDDNNNRLRDDNEEIIAINQAIDRSIDIQTSTGRRKIRFKPSGAAPGSNTTFRFCTGSENVMRKALILSNSGRARLSDKLPDGSEITCI